MRRWLSLLLIPPAVSIAHTFLPTPPTPKKLTLDDAVLLSLRYNPSVINNQLERVVQKYNLVVAKNAFELQYALTGSSNYQYTRTAGSPNTESNTYGLTPATNLTLPSGAKVTVSMPNNLTTGSSSATSYSPQLSVNVTQPLLRGYGSDITLTPLADAFDTERINRLNLRQTIISTIVKVVGDYYAVIQNKENLVTQKISLDQVQERLNQNTLKIKDGKMAPADNVQAQADLAQAQLGYTSAQNTLLQAKLALLNDIGLAPSENVEIDDQLEMPSYLLPSANEAKEKILANDISYQTSLIQKRVDTRSLKVAEDNERTQLNLNVTGTTGNSSGGNSSISTGLNSLQNGAGQSASVGLSLVVPIDDVTAKAATLSAKSQVEQDDVNLRSQKWQLESNTINTLNNLKTLKAQLDIAKKAVDAQQKVLDLTEIKRKYGLSSALDVSIQQTDLTTTRLNYINTQISYLNSMLQFRQLLGETLGDFHVQVRY